jgi:chemotaxis protein CheX
MSLTFTIDNCRPDLVQIARSVFRTMVGTLVIPSDDSSIAYDLAHQSATDRLVAIVEFSGVWNGALWLECSLAAASLFLKQMLPAGMRSSAAEDARDALGELANMLAGNLKSVLPRGIALSAPTVRDGFDYALETRYAPIERSCFSSTGGCVWITLGETLQINGS